MMSKDTTFSLTDLKRNTRKIVNKVSGANYPLYIMDRSRPLGVFLDLDYYNNLMSSMEDTADLQIIDNTPSDGLVSVEDYLNKRKVAKR